MSIVPNPAANVLGLRAGNQITLAQITDALGRRAEGAVALPQAEGLLRWDVSGLASGTCWLQLRDLTGKSCYVKFVKM